MCIETVMRDHLFYSSHKPHTRPARLSCHPFHGWSLLYRQIGQLYTAHKTCTTILSSILWVVYTLQTDWTDIYCTQDLLDYPVFHSMGGLYFTDRLDRSILQILLTCGPFTDGIHKILPQIVIKLTT